MKFITIIAVSIALLFSAQAVQKPSFHTQGTPTGKATGPLKPGEYWWHPELSPSGPLMVLVSVPEQTMNVYQERHPHRPLEHQHRHQRKRHPRGRFFHS